AQELAKNRTTSPPPSSWLGRLFPLPREPIYIRYASASLFDQVNSVPSIHMRCRITASLRATATLALRSPFRLANLMPQAFNTDHFATRVTNTPPPSTRYLRTLPSPPFYIH